MKKVEKAKSPQKKVLVSTFSHYRNKTFFYLNQLFQKKAIQRFSEKNSYSTIEQVIVDFGPEAMDLLDPIMGEVLGLGASEVTKRPDGGFCSNMNHVFEVANALDFTHVVYVDDDAFLHPDFIANALTTITEKKNCAFVCGIPQQPAYWGESIHSFAIPTPDHSGKDIKINKGDRFRGEMAACIFDSCLIQDQGLKFDVSYDEALGIGSDSDFLSQVEEKGLTAYVSPTMRFWHSHGATQKLLGGTPGAKKSGPMRKAKALYLEKWGEEIWR